MTERSNCPVSVSDSLKDYVSPNNGMLGKTSRPF